MQTMGYLVSHTDFITISCYYCCCCCCYDSPQPLFPSIRGRKNFGVFTDSALSSLRGSELTIRIYNMQAITPTRGLRTLVNCDIVPEMDAGCQKSLELEVEEKGKGPLMNAMPSFECGMLAVAAKDAGLLDPGLTRKQVGDDVCAHQKAIILNENYTFPLICPSMEDMHFFVNTSLDKEAAIMPELYAHSVHGKSAHEAKFWKNVERNKYCTIDRNAALGQERWKNFFTNLKPSEQAE